MTPSETKLLEFLRLAKHFGTKVFLGDLKPEHNRAAMDLVRFGRCSTIRHEEKTELIYPR